MKLFESLRAWHLLALRDTYFVRKNWLSVLVWPLAGAVLAAILWGFTLTKLEREKEDAQSTIVQEAIRLSGVYSKQVSSSIEKMNQLTMYVKYDWEVSHGNLNYESLEELGLFNGENFAAFLVVGPDGTPLTSTLPIFKGLSFKNLAYFNYHSNFPDKALQISSDTIGNLSGTSAIRLTRRLENPDGSFAGVLVVALTFNFFSPLADDTYFGKNSMFAVSEDGVVRVSGVGSVMDAPGKFFLLKAPKFEGKESARRLVGHDWFADGKARIVASAPLKGSPFRILVALPEAESMQPFETMKAAYYRACWESSVILLLLVVIAMYLSGRLLTLKGKEDELGHAYRIATERGLEGFYLWHFVRDPNGFILDFYVADCNERGAEMYGMAKAQLMGSRCLQMYPGTYGEHVVQLLSNAFEAGVSEVDFEAPAESRLGGKWCHRRMVRTREGVAVTFRDISDLRQKELELARLASIDALTGLPNRHWLNMTLSAMLAKADANHIKLALLFIDLDDFKKVNDSHGHAAGDELLKAAAARLRSLLRPGDSVVRLGGDEFTVILDPVADSDHAAQVAGRIVEAFKEPFELTTTCSYVGTSIGIGIYPQDAQDAETLLKNADLAMYSAKDAKGTFCFYESSLYEQFRHRMETEQELRKALDEDQFIVHYQPRVDTATGELVGLEALVRWLHPTKGMVPPSAFIPVAETSDIILRLGAVVMHKVCAQIASWQKQGLAVVPVAVNVSAKQFNKSQVKGLIDQCLRKYQLVPDLLEIELTESAMMGEGEDILVALDEIKAMGVKIHVDDFGTGYSSLALLQRLNLDVLKVDRAFTSKLGLTREGNIFVRAIISMAHALGMSVVAEGVETREQLTVLQGLDCDEIQGFYVSKPLPAADITALMAKRCLFPGAQAECVT
jgi:diguanylate cyclase (GGDEF)-like protein